MPRVHHIAALLFAVTAAAWAQQAPQKLEPLPEPPPPPQGMELDNEVEQQVTIGKKATPPAATPRTAESACPSG